MTSEGPGQPTSLAVCKVRNVEKQQHSSSFNISVGIYSELYHTLYRNAILLTKKKKRPKKAVSSHAMVYQSTLCRKVHNE